MPSESNKPAQSAKSGAQAQAGQAKTPKQLAAEARVASEAAERRRERTIRIVGGLIVLAVVGAILAIGILASGGGDDGNGSTAGPTPDASAASPTGVSEDNFGVPYGAGWTSADEAKLPTMEIWEDFQCPFCAQFETQYGAAIEALADAGKVKLLYRPAIFLDSSLAQQNAANGNPNSSARATNAWGCAIDQGKTSEFHSGVFANQPAEEGDGYSDQLLLDLAGQAGITGDALTEFTACVDAGTYLPWSANSNLKFEEAGVGGTPRVYLNGTELETAEFADMAAIEAKIEAATAQ